MPPPTTNLILHLDAGTFGGVDADPIGTLVDQSGNGNDGTAIGSNRPTYKTGIVNGLPVARFTAVPQRLATAASASLTTYTGLAVVKPSGTSGYRPILGADGSGGMLWRVFDTSNVQNLVKTFVINIGSSTTGLSTSVFSVVAFTYTTTTFAFYLNGAADNSGTHSYTFTASRTLNLGYSNSDTDSFIGDIAELLVYDAVLDSTDLGLATSYLGTKYDIAVSGGPSPFIHKPQRAYRNIGPQQRSRRP